MIHQAGDLDLKRMLCRSTSQFDDGKCLYCSYRGIESTRGRSQSVLVVLICKLI